MFQCLPFRKEGNNFELLRASNSSIWRSQHRSQCFSWSSGARKGLSRNTICWPLCLHTDPTTGRCLQSSDSKSFFWKLCFQVMFVQASTTTGSSSLNNTRTFLTTSGMTRGLWPMFSSILMLPRSLFSPLGLCLMPGSTALSWGLCRQPRNTAQTVLWDLDHRVLIFDSRNVPSDSIYK